MARQRKETQLEAEVTEMQETQLEAEVTEMQETQLEAEVELNADGLIPGQPVDWATLVRIETERKAKNGS